MGCFTSIKRMIVKWHPYIVTRIEIRIELCFAWYRWFVMDGMYNAMCVVYFSRYTIKAEITGFTGMLSKI